MDDKDFVVFIVQWCEKFEGIDVILLKLRYA